MIPSRGLLALLSVPLAAALIASLWPAHAWVWPTALTLVLAVAAGDALAALFTPRPEARRAAPDPLPLGAWREVRLQVRNTAQRRLRLEVFDHHPELVESRGLPARLRLDPRHTITCSYAVRALVRGTVRYGHIQTRVSSPLGLWWRDLKLGSQTTARVYPNLARITQYLDLATRHHLVRLGIHPQRRRGEGSEFHQLREYREGDALRSIDWKATSRQHKLVAREYQEERDQHIVLLLDHSQRMLARDDALSHFDHALQSTLLLAWVALRHGDAVGLASFGATPRWIPVGKGTGHLQRLLDAVYDLQPSTDAPDYAAAVAEVLTRHPRRCLVILITNLQDADDAELLPALATLRRRHRVLVASLRERVLDRTLDAPIASFDDALRAGATADYLAHRQATLERLDAHGVTCVDATPEAFSTALVNRYLRIKAAGSL